MKRTTIEETAIEKRLIGVGYRWQHLAAIEMPLYMHKGSSNHNLRRRVLKRSMGAELQQCKEGNCIAYLQAPYVTGQAAIACGKIVIHIFIIYLRGNASVP